MPDVARIGGVTAWLRAGAILRAPVKIRDGQATVPETPGTGVAWDEDAVAHSELARVVALTQRLKG